MFLFTCVGLIKLFIIFLKNENNSEKEDENNCKVIEENLIANTKNKKMIEMSKQNSID